MYHLAVFYCYCLGSSRININLNRYFDLKIKGLNPQIRNVALPVIQVLQEPSIFLYLVVRNGGHF